MKIRSTNSEIVLDFDADSPQISAQRLRVLATALASVRGVSAVRLTWYGAPQIVAAYDSGREINDFLRDAAALLRTPKFDLTSIPAIPLPAKPVVSLKFSGVTMLEHGSIPSEENSPRTLRQRLNQLFYGALTGGAFVMSWVGLLVPGIPTVPFVILTVYFAEKTSPALRRAVLNSPVLGQAMRDWHEHRAIRRSARLQALFFTGTLVFITFLVAPVSAPIYLAVAAMTVISVYQILKIPVIEEDGSTPAENSTVPPAIIPFRFAGA